MNTFKIFGERKKFDPFYNFNKIFKNIDSSKCNTSSFSSYTKMDNGDYITKQYMETNVNGKKSVKRRTIRRDKVGIHIEQEIDGDVKKYVKRIK